jgi:ribose transport system ATP-binding protein
MNRTTTPLLEMRGIGKRFPGVVALNNVSLEARPGEIVALVGENGAGKSTLMKILGGVHQPDAGEIRINGEAVTIHSVNDSMRLGIGFIHQELNVLPNLDVAANVFLGREPRFGGFLNLIDRRRIESETEKLLKRLGVDVSPRAQAGDLSIAHRQMIEIAKALSLDTRLLIMDEPTSSLTLAETNRLLEVVKDLRSHGVSVIYISHRLGEVTEIADRVVVLRDGANAGTLEREEMNHDRIVQLMVGRDLQHVHTPKTESIQPDYFVVEHLRTRRYPDKPVSFNVGRGEVLGVAGLIGAGRSEVAQALFGVEPSLGGKATLDGAERRDQQRPLPDSRRPSQPGVDNQLDGAREHHAGDFDELRQRRPCRFRRRKQGRRRDVVEVARQDPFGRGAGFTTQRRQSAEGRTGEVAVA